MIKYGLLTGNSIACLDSIYDCLMLDSDDGPSYNHVEPFCYGQKLPASDP